MVTLPSNHLKAHRSVPRTCVAKATHSPSEETGFEARIQRITPTPLPFPQERLDSAELSQIDGRDQLIDRRGGFVLTDVAQLPKGGQEHHLMPRSPQFQALLLGDMGSDSDLRALVFERAGAWCESLDSQDSALIFGLGDWLYPHGPLCDDQHEVDRVKTQIIDAFAGLSSEVAKFGVLGNHEYGISDCPADPALFMAIANAAKVQFPGRYYSVTIEGADWSADCYALDTSTLACDPQQQDWFQKQVAQSKIEETESAQKRWRIIMAHHPLISYGLHYGETQYLTDVLGASLSDVDLYCCGHEHDLEFIPASKGLPSMLLSGSSSETRIVDKGPTGSFTSSDGGFASLTIDQHALAVQFHSVEKGPLYSERITR